MIERVNDTPCFAFNADDLLTLVPAQETDRSDPRECASFVVGGLSRWVAANTVCQVARLFRVNAGRLPAGTGERPSDAHTPPTGGVVHPKDGR